MGSLFAVLQCFLFGGCEDPVSLTVGYSITLVNTGSITRFDTAFRRAAARWENVIVGDLQNFTTPPGMDLFVGELSQTSSQAGITEVDDLVIGYEIRPSINGITLLGPTGSGPTYIRADRTPAAGVIIFTEDFLEEESDEVAFTRISFAIGRVLGLGSLWRNAQCDGRCQFDPDEDGLGGNYSCAGAAQAYRNLRDSVSNSFGSLPLRVGPSGESLIFQCQTWAQDNFNDTRWDELMTANIFVSNSTGALSREELLTSVTIASLRDISVAYQTNASAAEPIPPPLSIREDTGDIPVDDEYPLEISEGEIIGVEPQSLPDNVNSP